MSFTVPNPFYAMVQKIVEARVRREVAKMKSAQGGCGQSGCNQPVLRQFVPAQDHPTMPGFYQLLNDTPGQTGIVYVNGQFHSVHPPGSNRANEMALAGGPEVKPGESATYNSEGDSLAFTGGCPHCGLTRGMDGNLYDAMGVISTNVVSGCTPCPANCGGMAVTPKKIAPANRGDKSTIKMI